MRPENPQFAPFMRDRRAALGLSIKQLADRMGMAKSSLHQWEAGTSIPSAVRLPEVAEALEMTYEDFLAGAGFAAPKSLPTFAPYLRAKYEHLPEAARAEAERFLSELEKKHGEPNGDGA